MTQKFYRVELNGAATSVCPVCGTTNQHLTGKDCGHVAKITAKGVVFYFWGFRPEGFVANPGPPERSEPIGLLAALEVLSR